MKNIIYLFLLISQVFFAQSNFEKGTALYQKGLYKEAAQAYESVVAEDKLQSAELYFYLGNCYYKLNKVAPSIYNYEKALVLKPNDPETLNNLKFAKKLTIDEIKEIPKVGFSKLIQNFTSIFDYNTWAIIAVSLSFAFLLSFIGYYFSELSLSKRLFFIGMFVMLFALLLSVAAGMSERNNFENDRPAIVFAEMTEVRSEPQKKGSSVILLHEGAKVYVQETLGNWKKIELTDGTEGWIDTMAIREVK
ncbi:tetratricopeptide repeat protein [Flavobacterium sp. Fl-77]|uniref:Tetratricopeptide repeat protein n=1 Tax=Flavobacterium flavipigmentatum TaxID=2893884 RepID=A0AAJ2VWP1_9FLAO|nr:MULTISPECIES: tetratricopeptide repeat protein [unclassified Flavobacterium]MDX6180735.1 tetratricopeptide repeat protein [Flavobacterium sp. Fl-33]MDX6184335.1 tetratricopeptide repeat protein [Flavobacterium sp. Fl-77]UFH39445.1 tetratricopeptide repeat protein [Flavobacterium sp. F-70]